MTFNAMTERYEEITVCGKPALFTSIRIRRDTIPDGLYAYDVRHDDECRGIPCEIAPFVMVNHWGTIILAEPAYTACCKQAEVTAVGLAFAVLNNTYIKAVKHLINRIHKACLLYTSRCV